MAVNSAKSSRRSTASRRAPSRNGKARPARRAATNAAAKPLTLRQYVVDAFTRRPFHGNPAAVVVLDGGKFLSDELMQAIAMENNLSETAFVVVKGPGKAAIRWFTPVTEVDLCGHATLAAAHVLWRHEKVKNDRLVFDSRGGRLPVEQLEGLYTLDFPAWPAEKVAAPKGLGAALGKMPAEVYKARDYLCVYENKRDVHELAPDFAALARIHNMGFIVTAPGAGHDFVCRCFYPGAGINEDPVTGSAHCTLVPYWASVLGRTLLTSHQVSKRSGELLCELVGGGDRVRLGGQCVTFSKATVTLG